jgi:hypothetical protein
MKIIGTFGLAVAASFTLMQSAEARGGHYSGGGAHFSAPHYSAPARSYSGPRSYGGMRSSYAGPRGYAGPSRYYSSATRARYSSTSLRNPTYVSGSGRFSGNRTAAYNSPTYSRSGARLTSGTRTGAARSRGFDQSRAIARYSASSWHRNWDCGHDHNWHGHRCHFSNGFWFIYDPFLYYPWGYGYYPYGYYDTPYYDENVYQPEQEYSQAPADTKDAEYSGDARVSDVQSALAREGYYDGPVDGTLGPSTRNALRRYQREHGLDATGGITSGVIHALRLR